MPRFAPSLWSLLARVPPAKRRGMFVMSFGKKKCKNCTATSISIQLRETLKIKTFDPQRRDQRTSLYKIGDSSVKYQCLLKSMTHRFLATLQTVLSLLFTRLHVSGMPTGMERGTRWCRDGAFTSTLKHTSTVRDIYSQTKLYSNLTYWFKNTHRNFDILYSKNISN